MCGTGHNDLRQFIRAVSAASLRQSGYPGDDVEMRERTTNER